MSKENSEEDPSGQMLLIDLKREQVDVVDIPLEVNDDDSNDEDEESEHRLMIDDDNDKEEENVDDPSQDPDEEEGQVMLERLPRAVNELNCRQARTFLVKLLRTANGGMNPHYGNPDMKPAFWPDYYWPWEKLTDVHTKPRGMNEPLQYSEMMKLAIARGYQYFGYDPNTYIDTESEAEKNERNIHSASNNRSSSVAISTAMSLSTVENDSATNFDQPPPRLPRPLSKLNCVQSRTTLARLLRYQQAGNNPVYGSPETRPPWWPDHMIRWVDMVDLRGKPPYLPDSKTYTDVLKQAIEDAFRYYGFNPETYLETDLKNSGLLEDRQKAFPIIKRNAPLPPMPSLLAMKPQQQETTALASHILPSQGVAINVAQLLPSKTVMQLSHSGQFPAFNNPEIATKNPILIPQECAVTNNYDNMADDNLENFLDDDDIDDDEDDVENLPPKLPMPIGKMNCSMTRTVLAKLIRFHCGNQLPNYGNPASMPCWWPNHLIDWMQIKNLSHRYEGYLGNTYSNCLRIAVIRGYAHYGLDANDFVEKQNGKSSTKLSSNGLLTSTPQHQVSNNGLNDRITVEPIAYADEDSQDSVGDEILVDLPGNPVVSAPVKTHRKPLPPLLPIAQLSESVYLTPEMEIDRKFPKYPQGMLKRRKWFPPKLRYMRAILQKDILSSLKQCKVVADRSCVDQHLFTDSGTTLVHARPKMLLDFIRNDLIAQKFTDLTLRSDSIEGKVYRVHKLVMAAHSSTFGRILHQLECDGVSEPSLILAGVDDRVLELVVGALYNGSVILKGKDELRKFEESLSSLQPLGILLNLRPSLLQTSDGDFTASDFTQIYNKLDGSEAIRLAGTDVNLEASETQIVVNNDEERNRREEVDVENCESVEKLVEDDEFEWEVWSFSKPGPRRSKRIPIPKRFPSGSDHEDLLNSLKSVHESDEADESQPLATHRLKRKNLKHEDSHKDMSIEKTPEESVKQTPCAVKKRKKEDEIVISTQQAVKSSPRLRKKAMLNDSEVSEDTSLIRIQAEPDDNQKVQEKEEEEKQQQQTAPKKGTRHSKSETCLATAGAVRPLRKRESVTKTSPISPERKRSKTSEASMTTTEEANSPNFDSVSEELLNEKVKEGQIEFVRWLMDAGFLQSSPPVCCEVTTMLKKDPDMCDGVAWKCDVCQRGQSVRSRSIFSKSGDESLCWIMRLILCWSDNTSLMMCQQTTGADIEKIFFWYDLCREYFGRCGRNGQ